MSDTAENSGRRLNPVTRGLVIVAGAEPDTLAVCPVRDIHNVLTIAFLLLIVWVWQSVLFTMVGHMMLARPGEWRLDVIAGGVLIATVVLLVDSYVIVRSSWSLQGLSDLKRGGLDLPNPVGARIKNAMFIAVRLMLSTVLAMLTALFLSILLFEKDITANLEQEFQKHNAALLGQISRQVDDGVTKLKNEYEEARKSLKSLVDEEKMLRAAVIDPAGDNAEFKAVLERVKTLHEAKAEAQREVTAAEKHAADELGGVRGTGMSGIPGYGPLRRAADERVASARRKLATAIKDIETGEQHIGGLRETLKDVSVNKRSSAEAKLVEVAAQRKDVEERLKAVETEHRSREKERDRAVRSALEGDPAYRNKEDGFLARLQGLERISEQFHVKFVVVIFHIGLFGVELAAVLAKIATFVPSSYTTILACQDYKSVVERVRTLADDINKLGGEDADGTPDSAAAAGVPPEPPAPTSAGAGETLPAEARDIGDALREVFPQDIGDGASATKPPHNDTAFRKRRGRPAGKGWKPRLTEGDADQSSDREKPAE